MDKIIWSLHAILARAAGEYALAHPENAGWANALPWLAVVVIYAWLAYTFLLGARVQRDRIRARLSGHGGVILHSDIDAAQAEIDDAKPEQDAAGRWWRPKFDPETGAVATKELMKSPPPGMGGIDLVNGAQRVRLRRS